MEKDGTLFWILFIVVVTHVQEIWIQMELAALKGHEDDQGNGEPVLWDVIKRAWFM